jgi:hypothetical protein
MTVAEMIQKLQEYPQDLEVKITDGFRYQFYEGDFEFQLFEDVDGTQMVDIGIGGFDEEDDA